ncbi:MAG: diacylglycerol kinase family protein [Ginsengibacter sp.]
MIRFLKSTGYAFAGLKTCFANEKNFRIQVVIGILIVIAGFVFQIESNEWLVVLVCAALVLTLEMMNTAIEKLSDLYTTSIHPGIKIIKDVAAGAVLLASLVSAICGCIIFIPRIILIIKHFYK